MSQQAESDDAPLSINDTEAIEARLPDGWHYSRHISVVGEFGLATRESVRTPNRSISAAPRHGGDWRVRDGYDSDRVFEDVDETAAITLLIELAWIAHQERLVEEDVEYDGGTRRADWLWALGERRAQLGRGEDDGK